MSQSEVSALLSKWNVPYRRNVFFTGRENILACLHDTLTADKTAALTQPQAISGLGGIGKTQTAVEYAYRYGSEYDAVLWAKADSREVLVSDFVSIADLLNLSEKNEQDQNRVVNAVKRWLQSNRNWLLILDNVDDLARVNDFIPSASNGHILLTTRAQATGNIANNIEIEKMEPDKGALFLLRRTKIIEKASEEDRIKAKEISQETDGFPLALDQAGAYIEEMGCSLSEYMELYKTRRAKLLKRRGKFSSDYPESVSTTWSLSFEKVQKANPAAIDLLYLCSFLYPDDIPFEIFIDGAPNLGPVLEPVAADPFELNEAIEELRKYSLMKRDRDNKTLSIHRLVQTVIKDGMDEETQRLWVERTVRAVNRAFPNADFATWPQCQRCLPHAKVCTSLIKH